MKCWLHESLHANTYVGHCRDILIATGASVAFAHELDLETASCSSCSISSSAIGPLKIIRNIPYRNATSWSRTRGIGNATIVMIAGEERRQHLGCESRDRGRRGVARAEQNMCQGWQTLIYTQQHKTCDHLLIGIILQA